MSTELLLNYLGGAWVAGQGAGTPLLDPVTGQELVRVGRDGLDLGAGLRFAREQAGPALRQLGYAGRAALLGQIAQLLQSKRDAYFEISTANSGTTRNDSAVDIDGAIYTIGQYARWGAGLGAGQALLDGAAVSLARDGSFSTQHLLCPTPGVAVFINAFNFPAWGLWEKAAPALLSGVPVVVKPATATAWLTQAMVRDVVDAGLLPAGALSVICGSSAGLLDALEPLDVVSFTGSAETAALIRQHPAFAQRSVRLNVEADSLNSAVLLPGADGQVSEQAIDLLVREAAREMTVKSGQKCTAIRRIFVPAAQLDAVSAQLRSRLAGVKVGNPRNAEVRMGSLVSRAQFEAISAGIAQLATESELLLDGRQAPLIDADPAVAACVGPTLLLQRNPHTATLSHQIEVFGPVATLMPYGDLDQAVGLVARGEGSLVCSLYGDDPATLGQAAARLAPWHGRIHVISPNSAAAQTGHGNVMPQSLHGGPGRAGGGEELGGLRALFFYHRRSAVQAHPDVITALGATQSLPALLG